MFLILYGKIQIIGMFTKSTGPRTEPQGTPYLVCLKSKMKPLMETNYGQSFNYNLKQLLAVSQIP